MHNGDNGGVKFLVSSLISIFHGPYLCTEVKNLTLAAAWICSEHAIWAFTRN